MDPRILDAAHAADRLRLPPDADAWVRALADAAPDGAASGGAAGGSGLAGALDGEARAVLRLPPRANAEAVLRRLAVAEEDAAEILEGWPSERWPAELTWLLERVVARVRADLGGSQWLVPGPSLPRDRGPAWRHFYVYAYLALLEDVLAYHARRGIDETVSWATLADLGRNLTVDRRMRGEGWPIQLQWLSLHVRGGVYELGRLQFQRDPGTYEEPVLDLHIPESGPLSPEACDASLRRAAEFFPAHFPDEPYRIMTCGSWLLDPRLADHLPPESNIVRFQRRFRLLPGASDADEEMLRFVFRTLRTPLGDLPRRTRLERAVVTHLENGGHWQWRRGYLEFPRL
jgi:hypothetical protein